MTTQIAEALLLALITVGLGSLIIAWLIIRDQLY